MVAALTCNAAPHLADSSSHYCPVCLKRVSASQAQHGSYREICGSGLLEVALLACPTCGVVLAAEIPGSGDRQELAAHVA